MKKASPSPSIFVSASAVGYYPDWGEWDEYNDVYGNDFLAHLCREWEGAARECPEGTRWSSPDSASFSHATEAPCPRC